DGALEDHAAEGCPQGAAIAQLASLDDACLAPSELAVALGDRKPPLLDLAARCEFAERLEPREVSPGLGERRLLCRNRPLCLRDGRGFRPVVDTGQYLSLAYAVAHIEWERHKFAARGWPDIDLQPGTDAPVEREDTLGGSDLRSCHGNLRLARRDEPISRQRE